MDKLIFDPPIPYIGPTEQKFTPGRIIKIQGIVPGIVYRFNINLQCGPQTAPQDDIALQVSVRISDGYIAFLSLQNGVWNEEKRIYTLPIKNNERFEIILICELDQYKVAINGQHYWEFPQRIHYDHISHLAINGDVSIIQIFYESAKPTSHSAPSVGFILSSPNEDSITAVPPYPICDSGGMPQPVIHPSSSQTLIPPLQNAESSFVPNSHIKPIRQKHIYESRSFRLFGICFLSAAITALVVAPILVIANS